MPEVVLLVSEARKSKSAAFLHSLLRHSASCCAPELMDVPTCCGDFGAQGTDPCGGVASKEVWRRGKRALVGSGVEVDILRWRRGFRWLNVEVRFSIGRWMSKWCIHGRMGAQREMVLACCDVCRESSER